MAPGLLHHFSASTSIVAKKITLYLTNSHNGSLLFINLAPNAYKDIAIFSKNTEESYKIHLNDFNCNIHLIGLNLLPLMMIGYELFDIMFLIRSLKLEDSYYKIRDYVVDFVWVPLDPVVSSS